MNKYTPLILVATLTGLPLPALAEAFSYSFISAQYSNFSSTIDGFAEDFTGEGETLSLSFVVKKNVAIVVGYTRARANLDLTASLVEADITSTTFGLVGHVAINDTTDFILEVSFFNGAADIEVAGVFTNSVDADGGVSIIGLRTMMFDTFELNGFVHKISIEDKTNIGINMGAAYYPVKSLSFDLSYSMDSDKDVLSLALTKYF